MKTYRSTLNAASILNTSPAATVIPGQWVEIGEFVVPAGLYYSMGWGFSVSQSDADGRIFCKFMDDAGTAVEIKGIFRIAVYTPDDLPMAIIFESRTETLNSSETDRTKQLPFPSNVYNLGQDYKFKFFFNADRGDTLDPADCVMLLDVTKISKAL